jgi:hypothetical protein
MIAPAAIATAFVAPAQKISRLNGGLPHRLKSAKAGQQASPLRKS